MYQKLESALKELHLQILPAMASCPSKEERMAYSKFDDDVIQAEKRFYQRLEKARRRKE